MSTQELHEKDKKEAGVRRLPQYITDQLLLALDNVRQGHMRTAMLEFEQCFIAVNRTSPEQVQLVVVERKETA